MGRLEALMDANQLWSPHDCEQVHGAAHGGEMIQRKEVPQSEANISSIDMYNNDVGKRFMK
jgi:hypothetical protein